MSFSSLIKRTAGIKREMKSNSQCQQVHKQQQGEVRQGSLLGLKDAPDLQNFYFQREQQLQQHLKQQNHLQENSLI